MSSLTASTYNSRLTLEMQNALLGLGGSLLGSIKSLPPSSSSPKQQNPASKISSEILKELGTSFSAAYSREWSVPKVTSTLSASEINFLNNNRCIRSLFWKK